MHGGTSIPLDSNSHEEYCTYLRQLSHNLHNNQFDITVIKSTNLLVTYLKEKNAQQKKDQLTKRER